MKKKRMIRGFALLFAVLMCMSCLTVGTFADAQAATLAMPNVASAKPGDLIQVPVYVSDNPGVAAMTAMLFFDGAVLTPVSVSVGDALKSRDVVTNLSAVTDPSKLAYVTAFFYGATDITASGQFFVFSFKVNAKAKSGDTELFVSCPDAANQSLEDVRFNSGSCKVTIKADESAEELPDAKITYKKNAAKLKYLPGYADGTFKPTQAATRYEVVEAFYNLFDVDVKAKDLNFKDVDATHASMVKLFASAGVINGYPSDNTFRGNKTITRAEFCKIVCALLGMDVPKAKTYAFDDIKGHWGADYITACYKAGYVQGKGEGRFAPDAEIKRGEVATLINRITGAKDGTSCKYTDVSPDAWYFGAVAAAAK